MTGSARRSRVALTAAAVLTLSAGLLSASADAAFPDSNGRIAFEPFGTSATPILTMKANGTDKRRLTRNPPSPRNLTGHSLGNADASWQPCPRHH